MEPTGLDRPLIGRSDLYQGLVRRREEVFRGEGGITLLEGDTGVGKSTILHALARESALHDFRVVSARSEPQAAAPFQLIRAVVRAVDRELAALGATGASSLTFPYLAQPLVTTSLAFGAGGAPALALPPGGPGETTSLFRSVTLGDSFQADRVQLMEELAAPLFALAEQVPVLVAVEDLQWADEGSLDFLEAIAPRLEAVRIWWIGTTPPFDRLELRVRSTFDRLVATGARRLNVRPLNEREVLDFVRWASPGRTTPPEQVHRWFAQTAGNPLFLEQLISVSPTRESAEPTPSGDRAELLRHQIRGLSETERRVLTIAAVLGPKSRFAILTRTTDENEEALAEIVERLVHQGLLRETENEVFEFPREELREELYGSLTETRRRILHRRVAEAVEAGGPKEVDSVFALARHYYLGRVDAKSLQYNRMAARFAADAYLPGVALVHLERALEAHRRCRADQLTEETDLLLEMVRQLRRVGELDRAERTLRQVTDRSDIMASATPQQKDLLSLYLALVRSDQGRWEEADHLVSELIRVRGGQEWDPRVRLVAVRLAGELAYFRGDYPGALRYHAEGLATAKGMGDVRETLLEEVRYARSLSMRPGELDASSERLRVAAASLERMGEKAEAAEAYLYLGVAQGMTRRPELTLATFERALRLAREANDPRRTGWALFDIADTLHDLNRLDEADAHNRQAREQLERVGDRFGLAQTYVYEGKIRRSRGDPEGAERALREALAIFEEQRMDADVVEVLLRLGEVEATRENWARVREQIADLDRRRVKELRPDLVHDLEQLRARVPG
ncbi:MAG TPA: AAA family ATPase [Thermoplasmata archaeon]|nr:AAA family ATPase [Thermoplasmata archaeon]